MITTWSGNHTWYHSLIRRFGRRFVKQSWRNQRNLKIFGSSWKFVTGPENLSRFNLDHARREEFWPMRSKFLEISRAQEEFWLMRSKFLEISRAQEEFWLMRSKVLHAINSFTRSKVLHAINSFTRSIPSCNQNSFTRSKLLHTIKISCWQYQFWFFIDQSLLQLLPLVFNFDFQHWNLIS